MAMPVLKRVVEPETERVLTAARRAALAPFMALDIMATAHKLDREGAGIVHMEVGEPGASTPRRVREAAIAVLENDRIGYTEALGRPSLRARIARHYRDTYGVEVAPERIVITTGSSGGFLLTFLSMFDAGARIAIPSPGYPAYRNIFDALGLETVLIETNAASRHVVDGALIAAAHAKKPIDGVLLTSPNNPTGTMMKPDTLRDVCATCDRLGITFVSDEVYHGLTYGEPAQTALRYSDNVVVANSFSKFFCMTGWRIGWLVMPEVMLRPVELLQQNFAISVPYISQVAAEAAFDSMDELEVIRQGYARNRAILLEELPKIGIGNFHPSDGAFYLYADIGNLTNDSMVFCQRMLTEAGVAATPGLDFDRVNGHRTIRLSFAGSEAAMHEAVGRLKTWLR